MINILTFDNFICVCRCLQTCESLSRFLPKIFYPDTCAHEQGDLFSTTHLRHTEVPTASESCTEPRDSCSSATRTCRRNAEWSVEFWKCALSVRVGSTPNRWSIYLEGGILTGLPRFSTNTAMAIWWLCHCGSWSIILGISRLMTSVGVAWSIQAVAMRVWHCHWTWLLCPRAIE